MSEFTYDLDAVQRITVGAVGPKGQRVFYMQARRGSRLITLLAEKEQVRALAEAIGRLLDSLAEKNPRLATSDDLLVTDMSLEEPLEPEFRVGQMGLGYDTERDLIVLLIQGIGDDENEQPTARFSATVAARSIHRAISVPNATATARSAAHPEPRCPRPGPPGASGNPVSLARNVQGGDQPLLAGQGREESRFAPWADRSSWLHQPFPAGKRREESWFAPPAKPEARGGCGPPKRQATPPARRDQA
jgi:uncharacterized repeat protein (TIGR03847 family)